MVNHAGIFSGVQAEIPQMIQQLPGSRIVKTASICAWVVRPHAAAYNLSKQGVVGLTKSVAVEYAAKTVRVNAVCTVFIDTPVLAQDAGASAEMLEGSYSHCSWAALPVRVKLQMWSPVCCWRGRVT